MYEFAGWFFMTMFVVMTTMPIYWKYKDKQEDKKIYEANREYYARHA
jgi:hypothetical protein